MSFILRFKAFAIAVGALVLAEITLRFMPVEFIMGAGVFVTDHRRKLAEASGPEFDYVVLGDSRSLSLMGHPPTALEPYSMYNLSLPAMGPRYYKYFIRKYFESRKNLPAAVIFAGDPALFMDAWDYAYHDKDWVYSKGPNESLARYLWNRFYLRLKGIFQGDRRYIAASQDQGNPMVWDAFSHRYLHMFNIAELAGQMIGAERVFILREAIPQLSYLYKYRDGIQQYTLGLRADSFRRVHKPPYCNTCAGILRMECHPPVPRIQDNEMIAAGLTERYGQINLSDRLKPELRLQFLSIREDHAAQHRKRLDQVRPALHNLEALVLEVTRRNVKIVFADVPMMEDYRGAVYLSEYFREIEQIKARYPGLMEVVRFPEPFYPREAFVEQVHYECEGSARLNRDFYKSVMPAIVKFAPYSRDDRRRSF